MILWFCDYLLWILVLFTCAAATEAVVGLRELETLTPSLSLNTSLLCQGNAVVTLLAQCIYAACAEGLCLQGFARRRFENAASIPCALQFSRAYDPQLPRFFMKVLINQIHLYKALLCLLVKHPLAPLILKTCSLRWSRQDKWKQILIIFAGLG